MGAGETIQSVVKQMEKPRLFMLAVALFALAGALLAGLALLLPKGVTDALLVTKFVDGGWAGLVLLASVPLFVAALVVSRVAIRDRRNERMERRREATAERQVRADERRLEREQERQALAHAVREERELMEKEAARRNHELLRQLGDDEKRVLSEFLTRGCKSWSFLFHEVTLRNLAASGVLFGGVGAPVRGGIGNYFDYSINDWAWVYLHEHPELVLNREQLAKFTAEGRRRASSGS